MRLLVLIAMSLLLVACEKSADENKSPSVNVGADFTVVERAVGTLSVTAIDSDGSIASYSWSQTEGPTVVLSATDTAEVTFTAPSLSEETTLIFSVSVTDDEGAIVEDEVRVAVELVPTDIVAVEAAAYSICALAQDGSAKCWGDDGSYNLGSGNGDYVADEESEAGLDMPAVDMGTLTPVHVEAGEYFGCALLDSGQVKCWGDKTVVGLSDLTSDGSNYVGDVAQERGAGFPTIDLGTGLTAVQLSVGNEHACAILNNGRVKCWGEGADGKLGYESGDAVADENNEMGDNLAYVDLGTDSSGAPYTAKRLEAGYGYTCAILHDDQLKCWGENDSAQLGYGDFEDRGDDAGEMGNNLPLVDLGTDRTVNQVFTYYEHTCAILDNGALKCWGRNNDGEIGLGSGDNVIGNNVPYYSDQQCNESSDQALIEVTEIPEGDAFCSLGGYDIKVGLDTAGNGIFRTSTTSIVCNVHDMDIVVGDITNIASGAMCAEGGLAVAYDFDTDGDGELDGSSMNLMGDALPVIDFGSTEAVIDVALGDDHTCALLADYTLKCWGANYDGQSGLDISDSYGELPNQTPALRAETVLGTDVYPIEIAGSYTYNCAVLNNGKMKCWGYDQDYATLGVPAYYDIIIGDGQPEAEMGDDLEYLDLFVE